MLCLHANEINFQCIVMMKKIFFFVLVFVFRLEYYMFVQVIWQCIRWAMASHIMLNTFCAFFPFFWCTCASKLNALMSHPFSSTTEKENKRQERERNKNFFLLLYVEYVNSCRSLTLCRIFSRMRFNNYYYV